MSNQCFSRGFRSEPCFDQNYTSRISSTTSRYASHGMTETSDRILMQLTQPEVMYTDQYIPDWTGFV